MQCPRCDGQGEVSQVKIKKTGEIVHLCDECDALWKSGDDVVFSKFVDFSTYVEQFGLEGTWDEVEELAGESS